MTLHALMNVAAGVLNLTQGQEQSGHASIIVQVARLCVLATGIFLSLAGIALCLGGVYLVLASLIPVWAALLVTGIATVLMGVGLSCYLGNRWT